MPDAKNRLAVVLHYRRVWLTLGVVWVGAICYLSLASLRGAPLPEINHIDKFFHFMAYAGLMGWFAQLYWSFSTRVLLACGLISMGIGLEFLQALTPERQLEVADMLANSTGVLVAWLVARGRVQQLLHFFEAQFLIRHESR